MYMSLKGTPKEFLKNNNVHLFVSCYVKKGVRNSFIQS
jgi:hypothetical protein